VFHFGDNDELYQYDPEPGLTITLRVNKEHTVVLLRAQMHQ
jgi:hypothetical protein